jgi:hypothetical protein
MDEIKLSSRTTHHLTNGELFEFCLSIIESIAALMPRVPRLQARYDAYKAVFDIYDDAFKKALKAPETEELKNLDAKRKGVFILLDDVVRKNARYSLIPEVQAAAKGLLPVFDNFAGTPRDEYEEETGAIINMLQDLKKPENIARIARLAQDENVGVLEQINNDFQTFYQSRLKNRYDFKQEGNTRQRANNLIGELKLFAKAVNGLQLSASSPDELSALKAIIANVNAIMEQFNIIFHRRLNLKASKKKNAGKKDDATQTLDATNPPAPETPPQKSDTSLPNAPAPYNQPPASGSHQLDPNEHPAMGER